MKKLAQVEQDLDVKSHELRNVKNQLGDKEDTLNVSKENNCEMDVAIIWLDPCSYLNRM